MRGGLRRLAVQAGCDQRSAGADGVDMEQSPIEREQMGLLGKGPANN